MVSRKHNFYGTTTAIGEPPHDFPMQITSYTLSSGRKSQECRLEEGESGGKTSNECYTLAREGVSSIRCYLESRS